MNKGGKDIMFKSIQETKKLFTIEEIQNEQVDITISKYLLSLPENKQIEVLTNQWESLKKDLAKCSDPSASSSNSQKEDVEKTQLQILIQVIEGMLSQV